MTHNLKRLPVALDNGDGTTLVVTTSFVVLLNDRGEVVETGTLHRLPNTVPTCAEVITDDACYCVWFD